jgi:hypothetical protein
MLSNRFSNDINDKAHFVMKNLFNFSNQIFVLRPALPDAVSCTSIPPQRRKDRREIVSLVFR